VVADAQEQAEQAVLRSGLEDAVAVGELGDPVDAIIEAANARNADLIVLGSNHRNLLQRVFERSVSKSVVKLSDRPVLVVP
jgi:nucleotide-binding universal stress UspA family protein